MQRKPFWKVFLTGLGYMALGNVMCLVLTVSTIPMTSANYIFKVILAVLTTFVFYSLMFTAGYKDGTRERTMLANKRIESPTNRWLEIGALLFGIMSIPSIVQIFLNYTIIYRFICGAIYPIAQCLEIKDYTEIWQVLIFIGFYVFIPLALQIGYKSGFSGKLESGDYMYKK